MTSESIHTRSVSGTPDLTPTSRLLFSSPARCRGYSLWNAAAGWLLVGAGLLFLFRRMLPTVRVFCPDFANIFAGAICLLHGQSPYRLQTVQAALAQSGYFKVTESSWAAELPLYPPFTLSLFTPLAGLHFPAAATLFLLFTVLVCGFACFRTFIAAQQVAALPPVLRGLLLMLLMVLPETRWALGNGNPVVLTTGLLLFCCFDQDRRPLRIVAFAMAVLLKPQIALPLALPLLVKRADGWRTLLPAFALDAVLAAATLLWCLRQPATAAWLPELRANLHYGATSGHTMSLTEHAYVFDPRLNLSYLFGYWIASPRLNALLTGLTLAVLLAGLLFGLRRFSRLSPASPVRWNAEALACAATAAFTLLPVYHRSYDALLLILALPWALVELATPGTASHPPRRAAALASLALIAGTTIIWARHLPVRWRGLQGVEQASSLAGFLTHRTHALLILMLALLLIGTLVSRRRQLSSHSPFDRPVANA